MSNEKHCPECGAAISADTPEALCPACLLRRGFETQTAGGAAAASNVPPPTPEALASRFPQLEIVELLGRGGMGVVYKARHRGLDRWVALKILPATANHDPAFAERFSREARALARLDHPHIVTVYDSGEADGLFYFIMEYVDGATLRQILAAGGITPEQALAIVPQICEALQYAHDQGIVHRDIKPENILVDKSGRVKIADFGIAKIVEREASDFTLTAMGEVMGTPAYMAPEQVEHPSAVDHRADIYSLGVVFYQMLTDELPLGRFAPPSRKVRIDVRLDEVVLRTLEKEPDLRYQQAGEVKTEVETIAGTPGRRAPAPATGGWNAPVDYRSKTTLWGLPLIHIAQGIDPATGRMRVARGIIAIGGIAQGVIAIGGLALGGIACGGMAVGGVAFGGLGLGLLALAGMALGIAAAWGGLAIAPVSMGGTAMGYYARGDWAAGMHIWDATTKDPEAVQFFQGSWPQNISDHLQVASLVVGFLVFAISSGAIIWAINRAEPRKPGDSHRRWVQLAVILLLLTAFGINAAVSWNVIQQRHDRPAAAVSQTPEKRDLSPVERFQTALQSAVDRRDKDALLALFNQEGVSDEDRKSYIPVLDQVLSWSGVKVECQRFKTEPLRFERNGKKYTLNGQWVLNVTFYNTDPNLPSRQGPIFQGGWTPKGLKVLMLVEDSQPAANPPETPPEYGKRVLEIHAASSTASPKTEEYPWFKPKDDTDTVYLEPEVLLDELNIRSAKVEKSENSYFVRIILDEEGKQRFAEITARRLDKRIGIVVDGKLVSAPMVKDPIFGGSFSIGIGLTEAEANDLAAKLTRAIRVDFPSASQASTPTPAPSATSSPSPAASRVDLKNRATAFVDLLSKGDFAKARAGFDLTMSGAMSEKDLGTLWKQLETNGGKFQGHDAPRQEAFGEYQIVYVPCRWERVRLDLKVVYNQSGQISGLWIVSPGASMFGNAPSTGNQPERK